MFRDPYKESLYLSLKVGVLYPSYMSHSSVPLFLPTVPGDETLRNWLHRVMILTNTIIWDKKPNLIQEDTLSNLFKSTTPRNDDSHALKRANSSNKLRN